MALFDGALQVTSKQDFFADSRRYRRNLHCQPPQSPGRDERKIISMAKRRDRKGHETEQQNYCGMDRRGEEDRGDKAPNTLSGAEVTSSECRGASGFRRARRTSSACPPEKKSKEDRFG